jgi:hypothetical protein
MAKQFKLDRVFKYITRRFFFSFFNALPGLKSVSPYLFRNNIPNQPSGSQNTTIDEV